MKTNGWHRGAWLALCVGLLSLATQMFRHWPYVCDDAFISLRYAARLADGEGLTWTAGQPVEGYSNLLWTLLLALPQSVGLEPFLGMRALTGLAAAGAVIAVVAPWRHRPTAALLAAVAVGADGTLGVWALGGLEQPFLAACVAGACGLLGAAVGRSDTSVPAVVPAAGLLALACLTRPDTPLIVASLTVGWWLAQGQDRAAARSAVVLAAIPATATVLQLMFRRAYYGEWLPNTARIKLVSGDAHIDMGALYVWDGIEAHGVLIGLAALALLFCPRDERARARIRLLLPVLLIWPAYLVKIGGDIFPAQRHMVVWVCILSGLAASAAAGLVDRSRLVGRAGSLIAVVMLFAQGHAQLSRTSWVKVGNEGWVLDGLEVGEMLRDHFGPTQTTLAISPAGAVPFAWQGNALDMLGLNDFHIARTQPADLDRAWIGHAHGDGTHVLKQRPGLILFCGPRGGRTPCFRSEEELLSLPAFTKQYELHQLSTPSGILVDVWVDREDPALAAILSTLKSQPHSAP